MEDIPHPYYSHLNLSLPSFGRFHFFAPCIACLIYTIYFFWIVPSCLVDQSHFGHFLVNLGFYLLILFLFVYFAILYAKPHIIPPYASLDEKQDAVARANEAFLNNWHCYDVNYPIRYCYVCKCFIPQRCFHCSQCGYCIELKDHHCDYFGFCIGRHNLLLFYFFFLTLITLCLYGFVCFFHLCYIVGFDTFTPLRIFKLIGLLHILACLFLGLVLSFYFLHNSLSLLIHRKTQFELLLEHRISLKLHSVCFLS
ncbi:palmitoyltransferase ZDHHC15, putative, partial [Entamoeba dispar SAW760]